MRREFLDPTNKYKAQYREIEDRIRERKRRMEEVEKLTDQVKKYREKADARLNLTERKLDSMTRAYEELNTELLSDIPKLVADKEKFFHPLVAIVRIHYYPKSITILFTYALFLAIGCTIQISPNDGRKTK